jgi:hypothetical protein
MFWPFVLVLFANYLATLLEDSFVAGGSGVAGSGAKSVAKKSC